MSVESWINTAGPKDDHGKAGSPKSGHDLVWHSLAEEFTPVIVFFARRYCNQLAHRRAASANDTGSCPGLVCDLAFPSAFDTLFRFVFGDNPALSESRRSGRIDDWKDREFANEDALAAAVRGECAAAGRMTDVFRAWCSDRGLPQRARLPRGGAESLAPLIVGIIAEHVAVDGDSTLHFPDMWAESLYWDAAQTGLSDPIDSERVQRWFTSHDPIVDEIEELRFSGAAYAVDAAFEEEVPDFHSSYLQAARALTRASERLDDLETDGSGRWWRKRGFS